MCTVSFVIWYVSCSLYSMVCVVSHFSCVLLGHLSRAGCNDKCPVGISCGFLQTWLTITYWGLAGHTLEMCKTKLSFHSKLIIYIFIFSPTRPLWAELVIESPCPCVCLCAPSGAVFFEASHWPWDHMISSRPLIGRPPPSAPPPKKKSLFYFL